MKIVVESGIKDSRSQKRPKSSTIDDDIESELYWNQPTQISFHPQVFHFSARGRIKEILWFHSCGSIRFRLRSKFLDDSGHMTIVLWILNTNQMIDFYYLSHMNILAECSVCSGNQPLVGLVHSKRAPIRYKRTRTVRCSRLVHVRES